MSDSDDKNNLYRGPSPKRTDSRGPKVTASEKVIHQRVLPMVIVKSRIAVQDRLVATKRPALLVNQIVINQMSVVLFGHVLSVKKVLVNTNPIIMGLIINLQKLKNFVHTVITLVWQHLKSAQRVFANYGF